jgi:hypothetical protein
MKLLGKSDASLARTSSLRGQSTKIDNMNEAGYLPGPLFATGEPGKDRYSI